MIIYKIKRNIGCYFLMFAVGGFCLMAKTETTAVAARMEQMKAQAERNRYLIVVCPYSQLTEEIKYIGASKYQHNVECTVVKIQKGDIKFGDKIKVSFMSEKKPEPLQMGTLRICSFDAIDNGESMVDMIEFPEYTEDIYKYLAGDPEAQSK